MSYRFWLNGIPLPITPGKLNIKTPSKNKTITLMNDGEINILKKHGLREISFEALLPQVKYPFANYNSLSTYTASAFIVALKGLVALNKPFPFVVTRTTPRGKLLFYTSIMVTVEDYDLDESAENGLDVMLNIILKEYKYAGTTTFELIKTEQGNIATQVSKVRDTASKVIAKTYTVKKGDTLWGIAKRELGNGQKYKELAKINKIANPNLIYPNQVLRLS